MGPNGSGKSTLALSLSGANSLRVNPSSQALLDETNLLDLPPEQRAQSGLFVSFQSPPALSGVNVFQLLRTSLGKRISAIDLKSRLERIAGELAIADNFLSRSLNDGFSGGERKKMELLQLAALDPKCVILDEIDTGVDIDALRTITTFLRNWKSETKTLIAITHRASFAQEIDADTVTILKKGRIVESGGKELAERIEKEGYEKNV
jgi:Fe-S cluster assembly ATP-binding protein